MEKSEAIVRHLKREQRIKALHSEIWACEQEVISAQQRARECHAELDRILAGEQPEDRE